MSITEITPQQPLQRPNRPERPSASALPMGIATGDGQIVEHLKKQTRIRTFCIKSQSRCDRAIDSFIVSMACYETTWTETDRKQAFKDARDIRTEIEKGNWTTYRDRIGEFADELETMVQASATSRSIWDDKRDSAEKEIRRLTSLLPVWSTRVNGIEHYTVASDIVGFGTLGLGVFIGEAGDFSKYDNPGKLWKRLGLAVIDDRRQGNPGPKKPTKDDWIEHGYSPHRRSEVYVFTDTLLRHQIAGCKDGAIPGPYGKVYQDRKAFELGQNETGAYAEQAAEILKTCNITVKKQRESLEAGRLTLGHIEKRARRYAGKRLIRNLWSAWKATKHPERIDRVI
jgi:hypothetical protein